MHRVTITATFQRTSHSVHSHWLRISAPRSAEQREWAAAGDLHSQTLRRYCGSLSRAARDSLRQARAFTTSSFCGELLLIKKIASSAIVCERFATGVTFQPLPAAQFLSSGIRNRYGPERGNVVRNSYRHWTKRCNKHPHLPPKTFHFRHSVCAR